MTQGQWHSVVTNLCTADSSAARRGSSVASAISRPLALLGGVLAVVIANGRAPVLSVASLVGFVALAGLAIRNGVLLVQRYRDLEEEGHAPRDALRIGTRDRLGPILITALTALGALVPLALAPNQPGTEHFAPMAIVVGGGLFTSTLVNLIVVPCGYARVTRRKVETTAASVATTTHSTPT